MIIELPDGREIEAPDGLPPDRIKIIVQKFAPAPAGPTAGMSTAEKVLAGIGHGMTLVGRNVADIAAKSVPNRIPGQPTWQPHYSKENWQEFNEASAPLVAPREHLEINRLRGLAPPMTAGGFGSQVGQALATAPIAGAAGAPIRALVGPGSSLLARTGASALGGFAEGATVGGLTTDDPEKRFSRSLGGGVLGGGTSAALPLAGAALKAGAERISVPSPIPASASGASSSAAAQGGDAAARNATTILIRPPKRGPLTPSFVAPDPVPEAKFLLERGVRLTEGLRDPRSSRNLVELASTSRPGAGPLIAKQRAQALQDALDLGFKEAAPPGVKVELAGDINQKYAALKNAWDDAYDALRAKSEPIYPSIHDGKGGIALASTTNRPGAFQQIVDDPGTIWDDANRKIASRFLDNQLTRLPEVKGALGRVELGDMMTVLSNIRKAGREALRKQNYDLSDIFGRAEDAVEQAIESQASAETSAALKALNGKYRDFKAIEDAVTRAGDSAAGVTPARFSAAVRGAESSRSRYASGQGGPLRDLSKAIATVFDESASPKTGARLLAAAPDWMHTGLITPTIYLRNASATRATGGAASAAARAAARAVPRFTPAAKGRLMLDLAGDALSAPRSSQAAALFAALKSRGYPALLPAAADEEDAP